MTLNDPASSAAVKQLLASRLHDSRNAICSWLIQQAQLSPAPLYSSIDLRDAGFKIAPVDCNLFPAGFNNICPEDQRTAPAVLKKQLQAHSGKKVLLIPESHTTNLFYIENLYYLLQIIKSADFDVRLGWISQDLSTSPTPSVISLKSESGKELQAHPVIRKGDRLVIQSSTLSTAEDFDADLIILNNDFSSGYPTLFDGLTQPVLPSHKMGWHSRKKVTHFFHYNQLVTDFSKLIDVDPWLLQVQTEVVEGVNFNEEQGIEATAEVVRKVLSQTQEAYEKRHITRKPFVFVKNNMGTYGMGITVAHSVDDILKMNRRTKNKMSVGKNRLKIDSVIVQEGVPTATLVDRLASEPVIYLFGQELIGGFLRTNSERGAEDNLNSQGMVFRKLCMSDLRSNESEHEPVLELVYGAIARLSALAAGRELAAVRA